MKKLSPLFLIIFVILTIANHSSAQETLADFKAQAESNYHFIQQSAIQNFSCLLTSNNYINFVRTIADSTYDFPLKLLWTSEGNAYFLTHVLPDTSDEDRKRNIFSRVTELRRLFRGLYFDWYKFALASPLDNIPEDAVIHFGKDTVGIQFKIVQDDFQGVVKKTFTRGGELFREIWQAKDLKIVNYPIYQIANGKWVCVGWDTQIYKNNEVESGMAIQLRLHQIEGFWLPSQIDIIAQSKQNPEQRILTNIYLRNFKFNENLQTRTTPENSTAPN